MLGDPLPSVRTPRFSGTTERAGTDLTLRLFGTCDSAAEEALSSLLAAVHQYALGARVARVVVDFSDLEFMMSMCISRMLRWMCSVNDMATAGYGIVLRASTAAQARMLLPMQRLTPACTTIEMIGAEKSPRR